MKLYDNKSNKVVKIEMNVWEGTHWGPDFSNDFFEAGSLPFCEELDAYLVPDVEYCIEQAQDWNLNIGDYYDENASEDDIINRFVNYEEAIDVIPNAIKRAELLKAWALAYYGNDEAYYMGSLVEGIPDGEDFDRVVFDLAGYEYDDDLDDMIALYNRLDKRYSKSGWYIEDELITDKAAALEAIARIHGDLPERIYGNLDLNW